LKLAASGVLMLTTTLGRDPPSALFGEIEPFADGVNSSGPRSPTR
jgi:hypothetical protein